MKARTKKLTGRNYVSPNLRRIRQGMESRVTLEDLSGRLAARGLFLDRTALSRIENQRRAVFDFEVMAFAQALRTTVAQIYGAT